MEIALYLDKTSEHFEKLLMTFQIPGVEFRFLNPIHGKQGLLEDAKYLLATNYQVTKEIMDQAPMLKLITRTGVGYENVDIAYARSKGIDVTIARGGNATSVAELVILLMLDCLRKVSLVDKTTKEGQWQSWDYRHEMFEICGKTVGILGSGFIGKEVIKRLAPFDVKVVYYDVMRMKPEDEENLNATYCSLDELLSISDIISIHIPVLASTIGFIGKRELMLMKKSAFLINTARGQLIDEPSLIWALENHVIGGAALDVFSKNPPDIDSPLLKFKNVITTPHIGGATIDAYRRIFGMCVNNIAKVHNGEKPDYIVNP